MRILRYAKKIDTGEWLPGSRYELVSEVEVTEERLGGKLFDVIAKHVAASDFDYTIIEQAETLLERRVAADSL